jgi:hypothetical protein
MGFRGSFVTMLKFRIRPFAAATVMIAAAGHVVGAVAAPAVPGERAITCTNPASGTTWQINVDYVRSTVDANAATISDAKISWHDAKDGGNYTLDRKSGALTFVAPSSTGGYFIFDRCRLDDPG